MTEKDKIKQYLEYKGISKNRFHIDTGLSVGFLNSRSSLGVDKLKIIMKIYSDISLRWLVMDEGPMLAENVENSGVYINGNNHLNNSPIDNRHYNSESPDILKAQIDMLDERIKEKDAQIKEKDAQIKEKDAQIKDLLDILKNR